MFHRKESLEYLLGDSSVATPVKTKEKIVVMAKFILLSRNAACQTGTWAGMGKVLYLTVNS